MDIQSIVAQLRQEASRIENAIAALLGLGTQPARRGPGRPAGSNKKAASKPKHRTMSASARAKISATQKARWAKQKGKSAPKKATAPAKKAAVPAKKAPARKSMSPAMKKKLSALMKKRWASAKKAGAKSL